MEKKTYYIPMMEIADVRGLYPMALPSGSRAEPGHAPQRRDPVF